MDRASSYKKDWALTAQAFEKLLSQLDPDRERAAEKYEKIRQKLMKFFKWRGCSLPEEYSDKTIDRVARRIDEGADLRTADPYLYFHGVALNVLREHWKEPERELEAIDGLPPSEAPSHDPGERKAHELERIEKEQGLECLDRCLGRLSPESRNLIEQYHQAEKGMDKKRRKQMAEALKIPMNALRIRAYRIRAELESCVNECLERGRAG